jgi:predicted DNA-binding transcriptional regulator YafY
MEHMTPSSQSRGKKRSSWFIFRRRLVLVRCLLRGPATPETLLQAARTELGDDVWGEAQESALRHDLQALRHQFGCVIQYRADTGYQLLSTGDLHLIDITDDHLQTIHSLEALATAMPTHLSEGLNRLLEHLVDLLPPERRTLLAEPVNMRFEAPKSVTVTDQSLIRWVRQALRRQQLQFRYRSTFNFDPLGIEHRVAPYEIMVRDGHLYLDADCLWADSPEWRAGPLNYRLDRIIPETLRVLPDVVPRTRVQIPSYALRYELSPAVACRGDVAIYFEGSSIENRPDGSAIVSATIDNLWWAQLVLMRYGANCRVLSPPELIAMMRDTVHNMVALYDT